MLEFEVKAVVDDPESPEQDSTVYLFNKEQCILLPIKMTNESAQTILDAHAKHLEVRPSVHNTLIRTVRALRAEIDSILIYAYQDNIFYSYIRVKNKKEFMEIDARPSDAISIALRHRVPVLVNKKVCEIVGVKVTRELLKNYI